MLRKIVH